MKYAFLFNLNYSSKTIKVGSCTGGVGWAESFDGVFVWRIDSDYTSEQCHSYDLFPSWWIVIVDKLANSSKFTCGDNQGVCKVCA